MSVETHNKPKIDRKAIQKKVVRRVLTILFIAVISVSLFAPQSERVAVSGESNVAVVTYTLTDDAGKKNIITIDQNTIYSGANTKGTIIGKVDTCNAQGCRGEISTSKWQAFFKEREPFLLRCPSDTKRLCTSQTGKEKPKELEQSNSDALRTRLTASGSSATTQKQDNRKPLACTAESKDPACNNKCSTTYVVIDESSGKVNESRDCSPKELDNRAFGKYPRNQALFENIRILAEQCYGGKYKEVLEDQCIIVTSSPTDGGFDDGGEDSSDTIAVKKIGKLIVKSPYSNKECLNLEARLRESVRQRFQEEAKKTTASASDAEKCEYKGSVVCYKTGNNILNVINSALSNNGTSKVSEKWECIPKKDAGKKRPSSNTGNNTGSRTGNNTSSGSLLDSLRNSLLSALSQPYYNPAPTNPVKCGANQTTSTNIFGRAECKNKTETKPQCIIAASKEEIKAGERVTIKWKTKGAEKVSITDIGSSVPKSEEKIVRPTETTTYKLTATGKGRNNTKTCEVKVVVDGEIDGAIGASPPNLSCSPNTIQKDRSSEIKWACPSSADSSEGFGIDTGGRISGDVTVSPGYNTQYSVACLDKDKKVIGKNSCSVSVGEPKYDMLVYPSSASRGDRVRVSWASLFMKSCRVTGPRGFAYNKTQGVVLTEPFSEIVVGVPSRNLTAAVYTIECESVFGSTVSRDVTVRFKK